MKTRNTIPTLAISCAATVLCGVLCLTGSSRAGEAPFIRGDADGDGRTTLADVELELDFLFGAGARADCLDAMDTDDNGALEITDPARLLSFLFAGGPSPSAPHPACGLDPTRDVLGCDRQAACARELPGIRLPGAAMRGAPDAAAAVAARDEPAGEEEPGRTAMTSAESRALPRLQRGGGAAIGRHIDLGEVVNGEILSHDQVDVYSFSAARGERIAVDRISAANAGGLNWKVEDRWGRIVASSFTGLDDLGPVSLLDGEHTLTVLPEGNGSGAYSFRVVDAPEDVRPLALGEVVEGAIDPDHPGMRVVYTFTAASGDSVYLEHVSPANTPLSWKLTDAPGRDIVALRRIADFGPVALVGGDYRLAVEAPLSGGVLSTGSYELRVARVPAQAPISIAIGETVAGEIALPGEVDSFTLSASAGQVVYLDQLASSSSASLDWEILDAVGRAVLPRTSSLGDTGPIALAGGDYRLRILGEGAATGTYQFRVTEVTRTTEPTSIGAEVSGAIDADHPGSSRSYEFAAPPASRVTLELIQTSNVAGLDWILDDAFGRTVLARTSSLSTNGPIPLAGGTYRVTVLGEGSSTGTFRFRVRDDGPVSYTPSGTPVAVGDDVSSAIPAPGGVVSYAIAALGGERIYLDLIAGSSDLDWELFDPAGRSMGLVRANSTDSSDLGPFVLAPGTYRLDLRARTATAAPAFELKVSNAPVVAGAAAVGDTISGDFAGAAGSVRRIEVQVSEYQRVFLDRRIASARLDWALLDPAGAEVFPLQRGDGVDNDQGPFDLAAGTYTLVLDPEFGYMPAYEIGIVRVEDETQAASIGDLVTGSFAGKAGATRKHTFAVPDGTRVYIDRVTASSRIDWSLLDPAGQAVFGPENAQSADADRGPFTLAGGTYTLVFDPNASYEPSYDFRVIAVQDAVASLGFGGVTNGALGVGGTAAYSFDAIDGQRIFVDLATGHSSLRWLLIDEVGEAVVRDASATGPTTDLGPFNLAAGRYRLVLDATGSNAPAFGFTAWSVGADLGVADFSADARVIFAGDTARTVNLSWVGRNSGGGPGPAGPAVDRLVISKDTTAGNGDDILLGDFLRADPVPPHGTYSRSATVQVPASLPVGTYHLLLALDAGGVLPEPGAEADNLASLDVQVVEDLPPVEPGIIATATFPFTFVADGVGRSMDVPLARPVSLDSIRHVHTEAVSLSLAGPRNATDTTVTLALLSGQDEVLEVSSSSPSAGQGSGTFITRFSRRLTPQTIALLPIRTIDGIRFRCDQASTVRTTVQSAEAGGRLGIYFTGCEFAPCGPHIERTSPGAEGITFDGSGASPWSTVMFAESVPGDGLGFVSGPHFSATVTHSAFAVASATSEAQLILDDGTLVTLDDSRTPSTLQLPGFLALCASHSLGVPPGGLAGRQILGFQWRIHATSAGLGSASSVYTPSEDFAVRFLYDAGACRGSIAIPPVDLSPPDGSVFAPDSTVTISGRALAPQAGRPLSAVLVNGEAVDSLDGAGRFFKTVRVAEGDNLFAIEVVEPGCGSHQALLRLTGRTDGASGLDGYGEANAQLRVEYADTTFVRGSNDLIVRARVRNVSAHPVRGPILMVLASLRPLSAEARAAAGLTEDGEPFVVMLQAATLAPGEATPYLALPFRTPERERVTFDVRWLVPANRPPRFETAPPARAVAGAAYAYAARAIDPDGDAVQYRLDFAPPGMTVDAGSGAVAWSAELADAGAHEVSLTADDGAGGEATQRWTLTVGAASANRPPYFATGPIPGAAVGGAYAYGALAVDPDGDPVAYTLLAGPPGLTLDAASGLLSWDHALPGQHEVSIEARDGSGAAAVQSFVLSVGSTPSNPSAPRITTSPSVEAVAGILFIYQPVASDPDGDVLSYSLDAAPAGMAVDAATGRIEWTPALDQVGASAVTLIVRDGRGGESRQSFTVQVGDAATNLPPVIETTPAGFALAGQVYRYDADAIDPEGEALAFSLSGAPAGMSIDPQTGLVEWTPQAGDAGTFVVTVTATDARGGKGQQAFELRVRAANTRPSITSAAPPATVLAGTTWQHDLDAADADGDLIRYELASGPPAMSVQPVTGLATWRATPADVGSHPVVLRASDCCGGVAESSFSIEVLPDTEPPAAAIGFSANPAAVGATIEAQVAASDNAAVVSRTLTVECAPAATRELHLDAIGRTSFSSPATGYCIFTAVVTDPSGNVTTAVATLQVGNPDDPLDPHPPVVTVIAPAPGSVITSVSNVAATISDATEDGKPGSGPITWTVELAPAGSDAFETIGSGAGEVTNAVLAALDPTLRPNGTYRLRITGNDGVQTGGVEYDVSIAGDLKLGNFTTRLVDLAVPLAGLPIVIARSYDSLDTSAGEFGAGWRLALAGGVTDPAIESRTGNGLVDLLGSEPLAAGDRIYVSRPDGRRVGFTFAPRPVGALAFIYAPIFEPDPGVDDKLEAVEPPGNFFMIAGRANTLGVPYNPKVYKLTTADGLAYTIDEDEGLKRIENATGVAIDVQPEGLFSTSGPAVLFERDSGGRILRIVEPDPDPTDTVAPGRLDYEYDGAGNLVASSNQLGARVRYFYEDPRHPHYLTRIEDPFGRSVLRNAYDDAGRLIGVCGSYGDIATLEGCTTFDADPLSRLSMITDNLGHRTDLVFDERGNLVLERRYFDDGRFLETENEYDAEDNLVRSTDPSGEVWSFTYGSKGLQTSRTSPLGQTWSSAYGECNLLETETGPTGNTVQRSYGEYCDLVSWTDPLGNEYRFEYDANGFPSALIDPVGNRWTYTFSRDGYPLELRDPSGRATTFVIDGLGDLLSQTDAAGRTIRYERDAAHRVTREVWNRTPERVMTYDYDAAGRITRASDPDSTLEIEYSAIGKVSRAVSTGPSGAPVTLTYEHDALGNTTRVADSLGGATSYSYDDLGRLVSIRQEGAAVRPKRVDVAYSASSSLVELHRFADLGGAVPVANTFVEYDCETCEQGVTAVRHRRADGSVIHAIEVARDAAGLVTEVADAEGRHVYSHDGAWRLLAVDHPAGGPQPDERYTYDAAGNRTSSHLGSGQVYGYGAGVGGNEIRGDDRFVCETDAVGNVVRRTEVASGRFTVYRYDHRNRLTEATERSAAGDLLQSAAYVYDASDRRIRAVENGVTLDFVHDGSNPCLVLDAGGAVVSRRFYGRGSDAILADEIAGGTRWYLTDHLGTVRDLLGEDGAPIVHFIYDSFGNLVAAPTPIETAGLGFIGRELSAATGLYNVRARPYDPWSGRFLQRDPVTPYQFEYADNSPAMFIDSDGRAPGVRRVSQLDRYARKLALERLKQFDPPGRPSMLPEQPLRVRPSNRGKGGDEYAELVSNIALELLTVGVLSSISGSLIAIFTGVPQRIMDALQQAIDDHIDEVIRNGR